TPPARVRSQRAVQPLPAGLQFRLQRAVDLRVSGLPDRARDTLQVLLKEAPHHPQLVSELARAQLARQDWAAVERLGTAERAAARDSSLLGEELATALERLRQARGAPQGGGAAGGREPHRGGGGARPRGAPPPPPPQTHRPPPPSPAR